MIEKLKEIKKLDLNCNIFSVYDMDGRTVQELLNQFFIKINETIDLSNGTIELVEYLVNEGLKEEIANKLGEWVLDGTLEEIINVEIFNDLSSKVNLNTVSINEIKVEMSDFKESMTIDFENFKAMQYVNVKSFGAIGDGETDDTEAFQNAINSMSNGGTLFIPSGNYIIDDITVTDNIALKGDVNSVISRKGLNSCIKIVGSNVKILNMYINGGAPDIKTNMCITANGVKNLEISDVIFTNFTGNMFDIIKAENVKGLKVTRCEFKNIVGRSYSTIYAGLGCNRTEIRNCNFFKLYKTDEISQSMCIKIIDNKSSNNIIENCLFDSQIYNYIYLNADDVTISKNKFIVETEHETLNVCVNVNNCNNIIFENNSYKIKNDVNSFQSLLYINNSFQVKVKNDSFYINGELQESYDHKPIIKLMSSNVMIDGITVEGKHYTYELIDNSTSRDVTISNTKVNIEGGFSTFMRLLENRAGANVGLYNNIINVEKGSHLLLCQGENSTTTESIAIKNNTLKYKEKVDKGLVATVNIRRCDDVYIEDNKFSGDITLSDITKAIVKGNVLAMLDIKGDTYDIISKNNVFVGKRKRCYNLPVNSTKKCKMYSQDNYNVDNDRFARFYTTKDTVLDVSGVDFASINDINSEKIQARKWLHIMRESNITIDIYKQCFVTSPQALRQFNNFTASEPLIDYKRPHGLIAYCPTNGLSNLYASYNGENKITKIV